MKTNKCLSAKDLFNFIKTVWLFTRSITGDGLRQTLLTAKSLVPELEISEVPTGTEFYDWTVPKEWVFKSAQILNSKGEIVVDAKDCNLHVVNYSQRVDVQLSLSELEKKLFSLPSNPDAIPYRTSYYNQDWGFCISENARKKLLPDNYRVIINSDFIDGSMSIGQIYIPGKVQKEILFTTYICHPSMANNELSGPAIALGIASFLKKAKNYYSYRILFVPETIGTLYFLSKNLDYLKSNLIAGYVLTCLGDDLAWNFMESRTGITLSDKVARRVLKSLNIDYINNSFFYRGSDERQYCSPKIDLPVCSVMRSKYGSYPQYHTSEDNLDFITQEGISASFDFYKELISEFEKNRISVTKTFGEPMLSKRNLRGTLGGGKLSVHETLMSQVIAYSDGTNDLSEMARLFEVDLKVIEDVICTLKEYDIVEIF